MKDLEEIRKFLIGLIARKAVLKVTADTPAKFEMHGTIPAMQGKKKVDGIYFSSVVPKPKDVRFYFFPLYDHPEIKDGLSDELLKCLKGKTCFHIKSITEDIERDLPLLVSRGIDAFQQDGLLARP